MRTVILSLILLFLPNFASSQISDPEVREAIRNWDRLEDLCRGFGDASVVDLSCPVRDWMVRELRRRGYCYGETALVRANAKWAKCLSAINDKDKGSIIRVCNDLTGYTLLSDGEIAKDGFSGQVFTLVKFENDRYDLFIKDFSGERSSTSDKSAIKAIDITDESISLVAPNSRGFETYIFDLDANTILMTNTIYGGNGFSMSGPKRVAFYIGQCG